MMFYAIMIVGGFLNSFVWGGLYKQLFKDPANAPSLGVKWVYPLMYGAFAYYVSNNPWFALAMAAAMKVGHMPAIFEDVVDEAYNKRDFPRWCAFVYIRGYFWGAVMLLSFSVWYPETAVIFSPLMLLMPLCYSFTWYLNVGNKWVNHWTLAEFTYGLLAWIPMAKLYASNYANLPF